MTDTYDRYITTPNFVGPPEYAPKSLRKKSLARAITRAVDSKMTGHHKLVLAIILQAVLDIGTQYESRRCWDNGSLDHLMGLLGIDPEYVIQLVKDAGLYREPVRH